VEDFSRAKLARRVKVSLKFPGWSSPVYYGVWIADWHLPCRRDGAFGWIKFGEAVVGSGNWGQIDGGEIWLRAIGGYSG